MSPADVTRPRGSTAKAEQLTLLRLVMETGSALRQQINDILGEYDLTESLAAVLWAIDPGSGPPLSMRELAAKMRHDPSNITVLSDRLESMGLVERRPHPVDGRRRVLALTGYGARIYDEMLDRLRLISPLFSLTPREQRQLASLLRKVELGASADRRAHAWR